VTLQQSQVQTSLWQKPAQKSFIQHESTSWAPALAVSAASFVESRQMQNSAHATRAMVREQDTEHQKQRVSALLAMHTSVSFRLTETTRIIMQQSGIAPRIQSLAMGWILMKKWSFTCVAFAIVN